MSHSSSAFENINSLFCRQTDTFLRSAIVKNPFLFGEFLGPEEVLRIESEFPTLFKSTSKKKTSSKNPAVNYSRPANGSPYKNKFFQDPKTNPSKINKSLKTTQKNQLKYSNISNEPTSSGSRTKLKTNINPKENGEKVKTFQNNVQKQQKSSKYHKNCIVEHDNISFQPRIEFKRRKQSSSATIDKDIIDEEKKLPEFKSQNLSSSQSKNIQKEFKFKTKKEESKTSNSCDVKLLEIKSVPKSKTDDNFNYPSELIIRSAKSRPKFPSSIPASGFIRPQLKKRKNRPSTLLRNARSLVSLSRSQKIQENKNLEELHEPNLKYANKALDDESEIKEHHPIEEIISTDKEGDKNDSSQKLNLINYNLVPIYENKSFKYSTDGSKSHSELSEDEERNLSFVHNHGTAQLDLAKHLAECYSREGIISQRKQLILKNSAYINSLSNAHIQNQLEEKKMIDKSPGPYSSSETKKSSEIDITNSSSEPPINNSKVMSKHVPAYLGILEKLAQELIAAELQKNYNMLITYPDQSQKIREEIGVGTNDSSHLENEHDTTISENLSKLNLKSSAHEENKAMDNIHQDECLENKNVSMGKMRDLSTISEELSELKKSIENSKNELLEYENKFLDGPQITEISIPSFDKEKSVPNENSNSEVEKRSTYNSHGLKKSNSLKITTRSSIINHLSLNSQFEKNNDVVETENQNDYTDCDSITEYTQTFSAYESSSKKLENELDPPISPPNSQLSLLHKVQNFLKSQNILINENESNNAESLATPSISNSKSAHNLTCSNLDESVPANVKTPSNYSSKSLKSSVLETNKNETFSNRATQLEKNSQVNESESVSDFDTMSKSAKGILSDADGEIEHISYGEFIIGEKSPGQISKRTHHKNFAQNLSQIESEENDYESSETCTSIGEW